MGLIHIDLFTTLDGVAQAPGGPDEDADNGFAFGGWQAQERLDREAALAAYTAGGAHAGFAESRFGRLARGQHADFIFVDRDPTMAAPAELRGTSVLETWVGGRIAWSAAKVPTAPSQ